MTDRKVLSADGQILGGTPKQNINLLVYRLSGENCLHRDAHNLGINQEEAKLCVQTAPRHPWNSRDGWI